MRYPGQKSGYSCLVLMILGQPLLCHMLLRRHDAASLHHHLHVVKRQPASWCW